MREPDHNIAESGEELKNITSLLKPHVRSF